MKIEFATSVPPIRQKVKKGDVLVSESNSRYAYVVTEIKERDVTGQDLKGGLSGLFSLNEYGELAQVQYKNVGPIVSLVTERD